MTQSIAISERIARSTILSSLQLTEDWLRYSLKHCHPVELLTKWVFVTRTHLATHLKWGETDGLARAKSSESTLDPF